MIFNLAGIIFNFPNQVVNVRLVLAIYYNLIDDAGLPDDNADGDKKDD